jgi:hypothetical protein
MWVFSDLTPALSYEERERSLPSQGRVRVGSVLVLHKIRLHLFLLDLRDVSFSLLPSGITFDAHVLALLKVFRTVAFALVEKTVIASVIDAAGILSFGGQLHLYLLDVCFYFFKRDVGGLRLTECLLLCSFPRLLLAAKDEYAECKKNLPHFFLL